MSHPLRAEVLRILVEQTASPSEMARILDAKVADVTYHTKRLVALDCAELVKEEIVQGAVKHTYRATERTLLMTDEWDDLDPIEAEGLVGEFKQAQLDDFVAAVKAGMLGRDPNFFLTRTPMMLDSEGLERCLQLYEELRLELSEEERRAAERNGKRFWVSSGLSLHRMPAPGKR